MRAHIDAAKARVEAATGWSVHFVDAPTLPTLPFVLLWSPSWQAGDEPTLCGTNADLDTLLGVTVTAGTPEGVLIGHTHIRAELSPLGRATELVVPGRSAWIRLEPGYGQPVDVDREITLPDSDRHPAFGVEMYRLRSTPAAG